MHLAQRQGPDTGEKRLYVLDESSLASTRQMHEFVTRLHPNDRVLLVGDRRQHEAVEAGKPFAQLQEAGMKTISLDQIVRQKEPELRQVVEQLARGEVGAAVKNLDSQGRVHEFRGREERIDAIAREYAKSPENTLVVSPDNRSRAETALAQSGKSPAKTQSSEVIRQLGQEFVSTNRADAVSIAIVRGKQVEFFNIGSVVQGKSTPPTKKNVYEIGSLTKLFTSLLLAHAVQEGRISLQDDVRRYLPGAYPNLVFGTTPVHIVDLANTTSALPDNLPDFQAVMASVPEEQKAATLAGVLERYSTEDMLRDLHSVSLVGKPGVEPMHSNLASELLGYVLNRIYGKPFETLLRSKFKVRSAWQMASLLIIPS